MAAITLTNVDKIYPGGVHAVRDLSLTIADGEFVVLVGPSGCGKSTVLRMVAGLEEVTRGEIRIGGQRVNERPPQERDIAMVFQNYALYPHKTVRGNLEFPLRMMGVAKDERKARLERVAEQLGLTPLLEQRPKHLSGGQRQRVAMGRAMVREPQVFLLDEPLSNLDAMLRVRIRTEIAQLQQELGVTTVYVTHDQVEAMTLGDRVAVLSEGRLQQVGTGRTLYERPANVFVAGFIGSPRMNIFKTKLQRGAAGTLSIDLGKKPLSLPDGLAAAESAKRNLDTEVFAGLRPEAFSLVDADADAEQIRGDVKAAEALGHESILYVDTPLDLHVPQQETTTAMDPQQETITALNGGSDRTPLVVRLPGHTPAPEPGETISLQVAHELLHLFDREGRSFLRGEE